MAQPADTVGAIATKLFMTDEPARTWQSETPLLQIMSSLNITDERRSSFDSLVETKTQVSKAEKWKWPVEYSAPTLADASYARGGTFTFAVSDNMISGEQTPYYYHFPVEVPVTDVNVYAQAAGNEHGIAYVAQKMRSAKHRLGQLLATDLVATSQVGNKINPLLTEIDSTGTAAGISQATITSWASTENDLSSARLTINRLSKDIRDHRRSKLATDDIIVCGSAVHNFLVEEAEARNLPYFDLVETFGKDPSTGEYRLHLETSHDVIKVAGAPVIVDNFLDTVSPSTVLVMSLKDIMLVAAMADNFEVIGWEDVRLSAAKDAQRAMITWAGFVATHNRTTQMKYINAKTS